MAVSESRIFIIEKGTTDILSIPWTPEKIKFKSGGQTFAEYDIMDKGTIQQSVGVGIRTISWDGILPAWYQRNMPWQKDTWQPPYNYQGMFSMWQNNHTVLTIIITGTAICMDVRIADYDVTYKDGMGNYYYYIEFTDAIDPTFTVTNIEPDSIDGLDRDAELPPQIYTTVEGDTLWGIAQCYLGDGLRWEEIYNLNKEVIEDAAKQQGHENSENGWWIFAGTVLKIPGISPNETSAGRAVEITNAPIYVSSDAENIATHITGTYYLYDGKEILGRYRITDKSSDVERTPIGQYVIGWLPKEYI